MSGFGGIVLYQGSLGSGKSASAVAEAFKHLWRGGVVACNFSLTPNWVDEMCNHDIACRFSKKYRQKTAHSLWSRFFKVSSLDAIKQIDVKSLCVGREKTVAGKYQEGQGLLILDESQLIFNSRKSMSGDKNMQWIEFFTQSRKLGWKVILIAHKAEMIDTQIRDLAEYEARMRNLQKINLPVLSIPLVPIPVFLVITRYAGLGAGAGSVHSKSLYPLPYWMARLYDSRAVFSRDGFANEDPPEHCGPEPGVDSIGPADGVHRLTRPHYFSGFFDDIAAIYSRPDSCSVSEDFGDSSTMI